MENIIIYVLLDQFTFWSLLEVPIGFELHPTLGMDVMSLHMLCKTGLDMCTVLRLQENTCATTKGCTGNAGALVEMRFDITSIFKIGWSLGCQKDMLPHKIPVYQKNNPSQIWWRQTTWLNLYLLWSQLTPVHPGWQLHVYPLTPSRQLPPLRHGLLPHSSTSKKK